MALIGYMKDYWREGAMSPFYGLIVMIVASIAAVVFDAQLTDNYFLTGVIGLAALIGFIMYLNGIYKFSNVQPSTADKRSVRFVFFGMIVSIIFTILLYVSLILGEREVTGYQIIITIAAALMVDGFFRLGFSKFYGKRAKTGAMLLCIAHFISFLYNLFAILNVNISGIASIIGGGAFILLLAGWPLIASDSPEWDEDEQE